MKFDRNVGQCRRTRASSKGPAGSFVKCPSGPRFSRMFAESGRRAGRRAAPRVRKAVTVGRAGSQMASTGGGFQQPVWVVKVYEAKRRGRDGKWTWRATGEWLSTTRSGRRPSGRLIREGQAIAAQLGVPFIPGLIHGDAVV